MFEATCEQTCSEPDIRVGWEKWRTQTLLVTYFRAILHVSNKRLSRVNRDNLIFPRYKKKAREGKGSFFLIFFFKAARWFTWSTSCVCYSHTSYLSDRRNFACVLRASHANGSRIRGTLSWLVPRNTNFSISALC